MPTVLSPYRDWSLGVGARLFDDLRLIVGEASSGAKIAMVARCPENLPCDEPIPEVLEIEVIDGWEDARILQWFDQMMIEQFWETRH